MKKITKSVGLTPSEQYLGKLCEKSFLSLWCWPNIFHLKGNQKHELCDLLVVFGDHVLIFSDKSCKFKETDFDNPESVRINWKRWLKKSVIESAKSIFRAERWLTQHSDKLFIDSQCNERLPIDLPHASKMKIHRIAIALNIKNACKSFFGSGSGSLIIQNTLLEMEKPFSIDPFIDGQFVHVFDDFTLNVVMEELNTIADFINYLTKKEELFSHYKVLLTGEEELLAMYLVNIGEDGTHGFPDMQDRSLIFIPEGDWDEISNNPTYKLKKQQDQHSYMWDHLIEGFNKNALNGTLEFSNFETLDYHERGLRALASENRLSRRGLAHVFADALRKCDTHDRLIRVYLSKQNTKKAFVFLILKPIKDYKKYRDVRAHMLQVACRAVKLKQPELLEIVGIATEPATSNGRSEDLMYYDASEKLSAEEIKEIKEMQEELDFFRPERMKFYQASYKEFPDYYHEKFAGLNRQQRRKMEAQMRKKK